MLKSAGEQIRRVRRVKVEVINAPIYDGTGERRPGTEKEFVDYLAGHGFDFERDTGVRPNRVWLDKWFVNRRRTGAAGERRRRPGAGAIAGSVEWPTTDMGES